MWRWLRRRPPAPPEPAPIEPIVEDDAGALVDELRIPDRDRRYFRNHALPSFEDAGWVKSDVDWACYRRVMAMTPVKDRVFATGRVLPELIEAGLIESGGWDAFIGGYGEMPEESRAYTSKHALDNLRESGGDVTYEGWVGETRRILKHHPSA